MSTMRLDAVVLCMLAFQAGAQENAPLASQLAAPIAAPAASAPGPGYDACANFNVADPEQETDIPTMLEYFNEAINVNPKDCFEDFVADCNTTFSDDSDKQAKFAAWESNYKLYYTYLSSPDASLISPDCTDIKTFDQQDGDLLGLAPNATDAAPCPNLPGVNETTPKAMDYRALGYVSPVTFQSGSTCFAHAATSFLASLNLMYNLTDESGQHTLNNLTLVSPQPLIDCQLPPDACDTGGLPIEVAKDLRVFPLPPDSIYPYDSGQAGDAGITNNEPCVNRDNPACATYPSSTSRAAEYYLIPPYISINNCSLSESQLVQALATTGPIMAGIASGNLLSKWEAYTDKNNTAVNLIQGKRLDGPDLEETFCSYDLNHAVLLVGYNMENPDEAYFIFKNSWGSISGDKGFYYMKMNNPSSAAFTDPSDGGTCGITQVVSIWVDDSA